MYSVYVGVCFAMVSMNGNKTINGEWTVTFHTVEGEVPALTAIQTKGYPEFAIILHLQGCILGFLDKNAVLKEKQAMERKSRNFNIVQADIYPRRCALNWMKRIPNEATLSLDLVLNIPIYLFYCVQCLYD